MLKIQEFINCFGNVEEALPHLYMNLGIDTATHRIDNKHVVHTFSALQKADMANPIVRETNCLILDDDNNLIAKAWDYPFITESSDEIPKEFDSSEINYFIEIPDGETVVVYNIDGTWYIGAHNEPTADKLIDDDNPKPYTYEDEIKDMWSSRFGKWDKPFENANPMMCFIFKYVDPIRDSIMPYIAKDIYLMGVINIETGEELPAIGVEHIATSLQFAMPFKGVVHSTSYFQSKLYIMRALSPGIVLRNNKDRLTVLNPMYKAVKNARQAGDRIKPIHIAKIVQACRDRADMVAISRAYGDYFRMLELMWNTRVRLWEELVELWNANHRKGMKDFAEGVQHHPLNFILFAFKNGDVYSVKEAIFKLKPSKLVECTKERWEKEFVRYSQLIKPIESGGELDGIEEETDQAGKEEEGCIPFSQAGD